MREGLIFYFLTPQKFFSLLGAGRPSRSVQPEREWRICFRGKPVIVRRSAEVNVKNAMRPVHPGEILREELDALGLSANALAKELGVPVNRHDDRTARGV